MGLTKIERNVREAQTIIDAREGGEWTLARLTHESTQGPGGNHSQSAVAQAQCLTTIEWSNQVNRPRFSASTAQDYRRTWERYGNSADRLHYADGPEATFADHIGVVRRDFTTEDVTSHQSTSKRGLSAEKMDRDKLPTILDNLTPEHQDRVIEQVARQRPERLAQTVHKPQVAREVVRNKTASTAITKAQIDVARQRQETYERDRELSETRSSRAGVYAYMDVWSALARARNEVSRAIRMMSGMTLVDDQAEALAEEAEVLRTHVEAFLSLTRSEDIDKEVAAFLSSYGGES